MEKLMPPASAECNGVEGIVCNQDNCVEDDDLIDYSDIIEENHLLLVTHLQLDRHYLFSYLRSKGILDEEDIEIVMNTGTTRQQRVSRFLDMIKRKGIVGMNHFVDSLQYENPSCYAKITGKKTNFNNQSPIISYENPLLTQFSELDNYTLNGIDNRNLYTKLTQTLQGMQCLAQVHPKVINERDDLQKKLIKANNNLEIKEKELNLREQMNQNLTKMQLPGGIQELSNNLELKMIQKDHLITGLQGKLLEIMEEKEFLRKENMNLKIENDEFSRENLELRYRYDSEKRQSLLLKEKVKGHKYDMDNIGKHKSEKRQSLVDNKSLREENIVLKNELDEFRKYGDVLNQKFKMVVQANKFNSKESNLDTISREELSELSNTYSLLIIENEHLSKTNKQIIGDLSVTSKLLQCVQSEWNTSNERCKRLEVELERVKEEKVVYEKGVHSHLTEKIELNDKYNDVYSKVGELTLSLSKANNELQVFKSKVDIEPGTKEDTRYVNNLKQGFFKAHSFHTKRSNTDVLNSIKRSLNENGNQDRPINQLSLSFEQLNLLHLPCSMNEKSTSLPRNLLHLPCSTNEKSKSLPRDHTFTGIYDENDDSNQNNESFRPRGTQIPRKNSSCLETNDIEIE